MLRTDRTSGHYHLDEMVNYFCHMSSVRGTSDGRGPVTRTRVPDRDEQGKPSEDARRGRCHPLEAGIYPCGCHRYRDTQLPSTKKVHSTGWRERYCAAPKRGASVQRRAAQCRTACALTAVRNSPVPRAVGGRTRSAAAVAPRIRSGSHMLTISTSFVLLLKII